MKLHTNFLDDGELILRTAKGDQLAFRVIYDRYRKKTFSIAFQILKSELQAEEVMQETMLKLWQVAGSLNEGTVLESYLRTLTRNRSFNVLRRQVLEAKTAIAQGQDWTEAHNETEEKILLEDTSKILQHAVALLPAQQKIAYQLCHQQGLKYEEAAERMQLSTLTVQSYMKLALRFLRNYVKAHTDIGALIVIFKLLDK